MMEISKKLIAGFATLLIALTSGVTYYIQDSGLKGKCSTGWELQ